MLWHLAHVMYCVLNWKIGTEADDMLNMMTLEWDRKKKNTNFILWETIPELQVSMIWTHSVNCLCMRVVTRGTAHSARLPVFFYSQADFLFFFCPAGATYCTDKGEVWQGGVNCRSDILCQISPWSVQGWGFTAPKTEDGPQKVKTLGHSITCFALCDCVIVTFDLWPSIHW